jgi:hypothetical protein
MKWLWRSTLLVLVMACLASSVTACKSSLPDVTGRWSGNGDLTTQMSRAPGSLRTQSAKAEPVQITMTLNQSGSGISGDTAVTMSGKPAIHLPITAGVVGKDGKVSIEADRSGFGNAHLSFNGNVAASQLSGDVSLKMDTLLGVAINEGKISLKQGTP